MRTTKALLYLKKQRGWVNLQIFYPETGGYCEHGRPTELAIIRDLLRGPINRDITYKIVSKKEFKIAQMRGAK